MPQHGPSVPGQIPFETFEFAGQRRRRRFVNKQDDPPASVHRRQSDPGIKNAAGLRAARLPASRVWQDSNGFDLVLVTHACHDLVIRKAGGIGVSQICVGAAPGVRLRCLAEDREAARPAGTRPLERNPWRRLLHRGPHHEHSMGERGFLRRPELRRQPSNSWQGQQRNQNQSAEWNHMYRPGMFEGQW